MDYHNLGGTLGDGLTGDQMSVDTYPRLAVPPLVGCGVRARS